MRTCVKLTVTHPLCIRSIHISRMSKSFVHGSFLVCLDCVCVCVCVSRDFLHNGAAVVTPRASRYLTLGAHARGLR